MAIISYLDLWWIPIIALGFQIITTVYLYRIHRQIGLGLTKIFTGFQILGYIYIGMILYRFTTAVPNPEGEALEAYRLFFGLAFPIANTFLHLWQNRFLKQGLAPNPTERSKEEEEEEVGGGGGGTDKTT